MRNNVSSVFPPEYSFLQRMIHRIASDTRSLYEKTHPGCMPACERTVDADRAETLITDLLSREGAAMIARFGASELYAVSNYLGVKKGWRGWRDFITARQDQWWWMKSRMDAIVQCSGFFPMEEWAVCKFSELLLEDIPYVDILGSWTSREYLFNDYITRTPKVHLLLLEPWFAQKPWTAVLKGKRVLVVHPFAEIIEKQYKERRKDLFPGTGILPEFELLTIKAVQSLGGKAPDFDTWFDALKWMEDRMDELEYDYAIIGCGAYGFHLAAHAKRQGKKAIHLGGVTQLLFGIKGNRWEDPNYGVPEIGIPFGWYQRLFNDAWVKPDKSFRVENADAVEGACYW